VSSHQPLDPVAADNHALATQRFLRAAVAAVLSNVHHGLMTSAKLHRTIPALPVRDMDAAVDYYGERFGFEARHQTSGFAVLARDQAVLHLWAASDEGWRTRTGLAERPVMSGAESFLAGTASCRIEVQDVDGLFDELAAAGVLHQVSVDGVTETDFGTREFSTVDLDNNALAFFQRLAG
jgi:catechol 2,3-dioxygenase-like lactoylglutathione lyase family enzyme